MLEPWSVRRLDGELPIPNEYRAQLLKICLQVVIISAFVSFVAVIYVFGIIIAVSFLSPLRRSESYPSVREAQYHQAGATTPDMANIFRLSGRDHGAQLQYI